jgi:predicted ATPase
MSDPRSVLQAKFQEQTRFDNFGALLVQMRVSGFRCHSDTIVEIKSPITAFCGLNGTGKSTLLQLAAVAYKRPQPEGPGYYIRDFLVVGVLDPSPFRQDARVEYKFWQKDRTQKTVSISRKAVKSNWSGYRRRLERPVQFAGVGLYLPRIEMRDFIVRHASKLRVDRSDIVTQNVHDWTCRIMDRKYVEIKRHTVSYSGRTKGIVSVERNGNKYSEAHMGCGEGRIQYLVATLEELPPKSLVLIEEPETSLHPHAQKVFGEYLVDVSTRLGHQILLTTHSEPLLTALPSMSIVYVHHSDQRIDLVHGLTAAQARSLMSKGLSKALNILVEDTVAEAILTEILRRVDVTLLPMFDIYPSGGQTELRTTMKTIDIAHFPIAAVLDGDMHALPKENIFKLPGTLPPEKELFANDAVKAHMQKIYHLSLQDFATGLMGIDHHYWCEHLANHIAVNEAALVWEIARVYAQSIPETQADSLAQLLREASRK